MSQVNLQPAYREVMATLIQRRQGRAVDFPGDNLLTEYANVTAGREPNRKLALFELQQKLVIDYRNGWVGRSRSTQILLYPLLLS